MKRNEMSKRIAERRLLESIPTEWIRIPKNVSATDLASLIEQGKVEKQVRKEFDKMRGYGANCFGGAAVMQRKRAYIRRIVSLY